MFLNAKYYRFFCLLCSSNSRTRSVYCRKAVDGTLLCLFAAEDDSENDDAIEDTEIQLIKGA